MDKVTLFGENLDSPPNLDQFDSHFFEMRVSQPRYAFGNVQIELVFVSKFWQLGIFLSQHRQWCVADHKPSEPGASEI